MDIDEETKRFKQMLVTALIFLVSTYFAYRELKYCIWGQTIDARVVRTYQITEYRRYSSKPLLVVEYSFKDSGTTRTEDDRVPIDWELPGNGTAKVQYLPGHPYASRLSGHRNLVFVWIFFASLLVAAFFIISLLRQARPDPRPAILHHRR
ncbi:MAG: hypothetical protein ACM359_16160 [Bacillota bacterium]